MNAGMKWYGDEADKHVRSATSRRVDRAGRFLRDRIRVAISRAQATRGKGTATVMGSAGRSKRDSLGKCSRSGMARCLRGGTGERVRAARLFRRRLRVSCPARYRLAAIVDAVASPP